jgi:XTP/dITP diphosphohydrolase
MHVLVIASNNKHKIKEMNAILGSSFLLKGLNEIGCFEELPETQSTIEGNSLQKAKYVFDHYHVSCIADDTGLEVEALNGEPGVDSAHYAGPQRNADDNIRLLLENLIGKPNRKARFKTVISLVEPEGFQTFEGIVEGEILDHKRGDDGFGYDPVFLPSGCSRTFAEMSLDEKNLISHRGRAIRKLVEYLQSSIGR